MQIRRLYNNRYRLEYFITTGSIRSSSNHGWLSKTDKYEFPMFTFGDFENDSLSYLNNFCQIKKADFKGQLFLKVVKFLRKTSVSIRRDTLSGCFCEPRFAPSLRIDRSFHQLTSTTWRITSRRLPEVTVCTNLLWILSFSNVA